MRSLVNSVVLAGVAAAIAAVPAGAIVRPTATTVADASAAAAPLSPAMRDVAVWIVATRDNGALPFMIVDKVNARVVVFAPDGHVRASAPVLLGLARGDDSPAGIGTRPLARITPAERITPAGRFVGEPGQNLAGRDILWLDYDAGIALHRASDVKPGATAASRATRLASTTPDDNRISLGCINVTTPFYDQFVRPFAATTGIVYILPETRSASAEFHMPRTELADAGSAARGM